MWLATVSLNVLLLPLMLKSKAQVKESVRSCQAKASLSLQTGFVLWPLRYLPDDGVH